MNFEQLADRAKAQHDKVEERRLDFARAIFRGPGK